MTTIEEVPKGGGMDLGKLEGQCPHSADDMDLIRMGKKPKMKRVYNFWTCEYFYGELIVCVRVMANGICMLSVCAYQVMMCATWACKLTCTATLQAERQAVPVVTGLVGSGLACDVIRYIDGN